MFFSERLSPSIDQTLGRLALHSLPGPGLPGFSGTADSQLWQPQAQPFLPAGGRREPSLSLESFPHPNFLAASGLCRGVCAFTVWSREPFLESHLCSSQMHLLSRCYCPTLQGLREVGSPKVPEGVGALPEAMRLGRPAGREGEGRSCSSLLTGTELCLRTWHQAPGQPVGEGSGCPNIP